MKTELYTQIVKAIESLAQRETETKETIADLANQILSYTMITSGGENPETGAPLGGAMDSQVLNRFLSALSPANRRIAFEFFKTFCPFSVIGRDDGLQEFGAVKRNKIDAKKAAVIEFLNSATNDIWSWQRDNVRVERKPLTEERFKQRLGRTFRQAAKEAHLNVDRILADVQEVLDELAKSDEYKEAMQANAEAETGEREAA